MIVVITDNQGLGLLVHNESRIECVQDLEVTGVSLNWYTQQWISVSTETNMTITLGMKVRVTQLSKQLRLPQSTISEGKKYLHRITILKRPSTESTTNEIASF